MNLKNINCIATALLFVITCARTPDPEVPRNAPYKNPSLCANERLNDLLSRMTLNEKIGQMLQVERSVCDNPEVLEKYWIGSVLSGGGSAPYPNTPESWAAMYDRFQSYALETRLAIPIIYGIDAVHGHNNVYGAVVFPHHIGMGATSDPAVVEAAARVTAEEVAGTGIDWTFAPCIAVPRDERWGRTYEGYGESSALAGVLAAAEIAGFQGGNSETTCIAACAKHFAGDGGTAGGKDRGDTRLDEEAFRKIHIAAYKAAIDAGVYTVMISFSSYNGEKMHGSARWITDVLKGELGFKGFVVSDWMGVDHLDPSYTECVRRAVNAGIDMIMVPYDFKKCFLAIKALVEKGEIEKERIDDAVSRILGVKIRLGLFEHPFTDKSLTAAIGSDEHREVARRAVRESVVLLKNARGILPLAKNIRSLLVCGKCANDIGIQCGGWTISWQGSPGRITPGTTILDGIKSTVSRATHVTYSEDGNGTGSFDAAIVAVGEYPYAEMYGDKESVTLSSADADLMRSVTSRGIPVVALIVSGRPLILADAIDWCDAILAVWLPGTEGGGIADVLFGDYKPTGKMSHTWPKNMKQVPINVGDKMYDPLFPFGFGLSYSFTPGRE